MKKEVEIAHIKSLIYSIDEQNQKLGWQLDESQLNRAIQKDLEQRYQLLMEDALAPSAKAFFGMKMFGLRGQHYDRLELEGLPNLEGLSVGMNSAVKTVAISDLPQLKSIEIQDGKVEKVVLLDLPLLHTLWLNVNVLSSLELPGLESLKSLGFGRNLIREIELNYLTNLESLYCGDNLLERLEVTPLKQLKGAVGKGQLLF